MQTDYIRGYIAKKKLTEGIHYGRLYRVTYTGMKTDNGKPAMNKDTRPSWSGTSRTSMAGGVTRPRRPWCSAATARWSRRFAPSPRPPPRPIPGFRRCGPWMAWARSSRPM